MEERLSKAEARLERHGADIRVLQKKTDETSESVRVIQTAVIQIKFSVFGGIAFFLVSQVGLFEALKIAT